jgi:hypothetical protein
MKKQPRPADLQSTATDIAEKLAPYWGRLSSVPEGVPIQAALALGGRIPWYAEAAVDPSDDDTPWSGRVVLISDDVFVVMTREPGNTAETVALTRSFEPIAVRLVGDDDAWTDLPRTRPPGTAFIDFVFEDGSDVRVPMATGSLRVQANDKALWERFFDILERLHQGAKS